MRQDNAGQLIHLGVSQARVGSFLRLLAMNSLLESIAILASFPA